MATHSTMIQRKTISKLRRRFLKHIWVARVSLLLVGVVGLYLLFLFVVWFMRVSPIGNLIGPAKNFIFAPQGQILETDDRTNVVLLGRGGEGHEAPDLTDTIIFGSISQRENKAVMVSIPRDIWVESLEAKVNSAFYWGKTKKPEDSKAGLIMAKAVIEEIVGVPIHYAAVLDFSGFRRIIDELGGIEVNVERAFIDDKYPIPGKENDLCDGEEQSSSSSKEYKCRYETIRFEQGSQMMNGDTALKFSRSRNAQGDEGTDFARAARQQKVIDGIKSKVLTLGVIFSPEKIDGLAKVVEGSIDTDITDEAGAVLARKAFDSRDNIKSYVLSEDFLVRPPISRLYQNQYVFIPKAGRGNWSEVHSWIQSILP